MNFHSKWLNFYQEINQPDENIDLIKASLYFAQTQYIDLNVQTYLDKIDAIAQEIKKRLLTTIYPLKIIKIINQYLYQELNFQGNYQDYYNPSNSFINEVIHRRIGIPITLSIVYLGIAKRINFPMVGIGMPGHFLIRPQFENVGIFIDAFHQGEILFPHDCEDKLKEIYQQIIKLDAHLIPIVSNRQILLRMLTNLKFIYIQQQKLDKALNIIEGILMLYPQDFQEIRDKGIVYYHIGEWGKASQDLSFYLAMFPNAEDADIIRHLLEKIN